MFFKRNAAAAAGAGTDAECVSDPADRSGSAGRGDADQHLFRAVCSAGQRQWFCQHQPVYFGGDRQKKRKSGTGIGVCGALQPVAEHHSGRQRVCLCTMACGAVSEVRCTGECGAVAGSDAALYIGMRLPQGIFSCKAQGDDSGDSGRHRISDPRGGACLRRDFSAARRILQPVYADCDQHAAGTAGGVLLSGGICTADPKAEMPVPCVSGGLPGLPCPCC